jgi:cell division transport system permease protein
MTALQTALTNLRRSPYQSLLAIMVMTITFFVANTFGLTLLGANQVLKFFETRPQVIAFFQLQADDATINQVSQDLKAKSYVADVKTVSKAQALELYRKDNKDNPLLLELVTADILPASLEVSAKQAADLPQIKKDLEQAKSVEEVVFQDEVLSSLLQWTNSIRLVGIFIVAVLAVTSFLTVVVLVSMKTVTRKSAVSIMQIIGATHWYILAPFVFEGIIYGLIGAVFGSGLMYAALLYATPWFESFLNGIVSFPVPYQVLLIQFGISLGIGLLLGASASWVAARRLLRR